MPNCANRRCCARSVSSVISPNAKFQAHPFEANLFEEAQIVIADAGGVQAVAEFGIPRIAFFDLRDPLLRVKRNAGRQRGPEELATKHRITLFEDGGPVKPLVL